MNLLSKVASWLSSRLSRIADGFRPVRREQLPPSITLDLPRASTMPFDPMLLERVKNQWLFGEYESLIKVTELEVTGHPQRGLVAAYIAAGWEQVSEGPSVAIQWYARAKDWGCPSDKLFEIALANTHITMADMSALLGDEQRAENFIQLGLQDVGPGIPLRQLADMRLASTRSRHRNFKIGVNGGDRSLPTFPAVQSEQYSTEKSHEPVSGTGATTTERSGLPETETKSETAEDSRAEQLRNALRESLQD